MTAATGRADYDQLFKTSTLQTNEPRFVLRAGDAVAADTVRAWVALAHRAGTPAEACELALQQADIMEAWPTKKVPDGPELAASERLNLRNQFSRRAWAARDLTPTAEIALAQQLGADAVLGRLRPILIDLLANIIVAGDLGDMGPRYVLTTHADGEVTPALRALYALAGHNFDQRMADKQGPEAG